MNIFDQFVDKSKEVLSSAANKTEEVVTREKLKLQINQATKYLQEQQAKLGALVYGFYLAKEEDEGLLQEYIDDVESALDKSDELKKQLELMQQQKYCGCCGEQNKGTAEFCYKCGAQLQ